MIEHVTTAGVFSLDGQDFDVENNIWLIGDDHEVLVVDAAHDADPIVAAVGGRSVRAILCTHGHNDHINAADELSRAIGGAPVLLHPDDEMLWDAVYPDPKPDRAVRDGDELEVAGERLRIAHTPGHSPGASASSAPTGTCSAATRCSTAVPARPAGRTPTSRRSSSRFAIGCSCSPATRWCTPATGSPRPWGRGAAPQRLGRPGALTPRHLSDSHCL